MEMRHKSNSSSSSDEPGLQHMRPGRRVRENLPSWHEHSGLTIEEDDMMEDFTTFDIPERNEIWGRV
jgi:hypothetical protein